MEDDDLIEISGEDDSLLQQIPNDDSNRTYFSCSPLQMPRSNPAPYPSITSPIESLNSSAVRDSINKENISANKPEVPKLSMEPQPMKRKKKGGGYNLRKSLAWDRAFFTEEGVLDPLELSMINGNINQSGGERLSVIHEERRESLLGLDCSSESTNLQALEENLFKELPVSIRNEDKNVAGGLLSKNDSPTRDNVAPASVAKRKVLSTHDDNSTRSKRSGNPRPVNSPSLKRPSRVSTRYAPTKESKVAKIPVPKTNPSFLPNAAKRATPATSTSKQNQTAKTVNVQKSTRLTSSSNNNKGARNDGKSNLAPKYSIPKSTLQQASKKDISASETHSSTISQHLLVPKANSRFKTNSDSVLPAPGHAMNGCDADSSNNAVSFPPNACSIDRSMQCLPASLQTVKPSGLRMPSPSLGLFSLSKLSSSDIPLQRSTQPFNLSQSNIIDSRKPRVLDSYNKKPPCTPKNLSESAMTARFVKILGSSAGHSNQSTAYTTLHKNMKLNSGNNIREVEATTPYPKHQTTNNQQQSHGILDDADKQLLDHVEPCKIQKFSCVVSQKNENELLPCGEQKRDDDNRGSQDVSRKQNNLRGVDDFHLTSHIKMPIEVKSITGSNGLATDQLIEGKEYHSSVENHDVSSELKFSDAHSYDACGSLKSGDALLGCKFLVNDQCQEQHGILRPSIFEEHVVNVDSQRTEVKKGFSVKKNDFLEDMEKVRTDTQEHVSGAGELGRSDVSSYSEVKQKAEDLGLQSSDANPSLEFDSNVKKTSILDNRCLLVIDDAAEKSEEKELSHSSLFVDQVFQVASGFHLNETQGFSAEGSRLDNLPKKVIFFASEGTNERDSRSSAALCLMPQALQDCGENECLQMENHILGSTCAELGLELEVNDQATSESERTSKDQINAAEIAFEIDIPKIAAKANENVLKNSAALCLKPLPKEVSGQTMGVQYMDDHVSGSGNPLYEQAIRLLVEATPSLPDERGRITGMGMATEIDTTNSFTNSGEASAEMECRHMDAHVLALIHAQFERGMEGHGQSISSGSERMSKDTRKGTGDSTEIDINNVVARAKEEELESAVALSLTPQAMHDFAEIAKSHIMEDHERGSNDAQCGQKIEVHGQPTSESESGSKYQRSGTRIGFEQDIRILVESTSSLSDGRDQISDIGMASEIDTRNAFSNSEELCDEMVEHHHLEKLSAEMVECHHMEAVADVKNFSNVGARATESELKSSSALCLMPLAVEDCDEMEWHPIKDDHVSVSTSAKYEQDISLPMEATSSEPEGNDQITSTGMNSEIGITSVSLDSKEFGPRYSEDLYSGAECISSAKHNVLTENSDVKDKQCNLLVKIHNSTFDIQNVEAIRYTGQCVLEVQNDCPSWKHDVHEESTEQTKLTESYFNKGGKTPQLKNQSPNAFHGRLFEGGSPAGVSLKVEGCPERGMRSQFECTGQVNEDRSRSVLKEQIQILNNSCTSVLNNISTDIAEQVSKGDHVELLANIIFCEESQKKDMIQTDCDVHGQPYVYQIESHGSTNCTLLEPVAENEGAKMVENNPKVNYSPGFVESEMSVENLKCQVDMRSADDSQLSDQAACSELYSSLTDKAQISPSSSTSKSKAVCSLNEESGLSIEHGLEHAKLDLAESSILLEETEASMPQNSGVPKSEMQHESGHGIHISEESYAKMSICTGTGDGKKLDALVIKPPRHAAPFSDEWLAAFEAAGEEILTLKSGAVQNSPPQQSLPEPGPWSPVKRKNHQEIGPFDCTKFTNTNISPDFD